MTSKELKDFFDAHLVPKRLYDLKRNHRGRLCMEQEKDGWAVYFSDNKQKVGKLLFQTESDACLRLKEEVRKFMEVVYGLTWYA